ncbi:lipopolysaccharide biosynthesis protein [Nocardioides alkalitolerans]|uniref:lipopolysaccharide biosynthesis protein n=1 Tax=Nocardioides alkalitolerans TaxID=281714 RepID=UPI0004024BC4|nr:oligosaccharide flippase family protein [Nocardioides alkalitolerans]
MPAAAVSDAAGTDLRTSQGEVGAGQDRSDDRRSMARSGAVSLAGSLVAAVGGFALTIIVGRLFGAHLSGLYFQAVAVFMILNGIAVAGSDTGLVRALSARRAVGADRRAWHALTVTLTPVLLWSLVVAAVLAVMADDLAATFEPADQEVVRAFLLVLAGTLVASAVGQAALNGTRSLGSVLPYVVLYQLWLPASRVLAVGLLAFVDAPATLLLLTYAVPLVLMDVVAVVYLVRRLRRAAADAPRLDDEAGARRTEAVEVWGFNLPRGVASCLELAIVWADVIIVGILLGPAAAGAYAAASRFVTTGTMAMEALRLQSAPHLAASWSRGDRDRFVDVYQVTTVWLVLLSWPLFLGLATWSPLLLGFIGDDFAVAAPALTVLALGMLVYVAMGNVNSALLMAGLSGVTAMNTAVALALNVVLNLALVPVLGLVGAAIAWAACLAIDSILCFVRGRGRTGVAMPWRPVALAGASAVVAFGVPGLAVRLLAEPSLVWASAHLVGGLAVYAVLLHHFRGALGLPAFLPLLRRSS